MVLGLAQYGVIDLHLHLDGSLSPAWMIEWAKKQAVNLPASTAEALTAYVSVPQDCSDLNEYLRCFDLPLSLLQTPEALSSAVTDLIQRLDQDGLVYAEIRFAPQLHTQRSMSQEDAVKAALRGLQAGLASTSLFKANLILCCMRAADNRSANLETICLAKQYLTKYEAGVVAIDLAGAEGLFATQHFQQEFDFANQRGVPFTIHAGEAAGPESVQQALDFGATRIGHGIRAIESETVMKQLIDKRTPLEMCPCSNLQTKTVAQLADYPLRTFLMRGVVATLNTDNMTVSQTCIQQEYRLLAEQYQLSISEAKQLLLNSIAAAFLSNEDKKALLAHIQQRYPQLI
ncbi:adenosine deaminase [[Haemophilus] ducreyi]|uniref:Adenosine deaminase n=2 Tax=Haemophilus ducreyi TaxID=730 RepID=ADD_HAEDU|nr:adenosine deaminase [[Haemophilus] ducreyi]Q7VNV1.1 RecName: Full=Adenosine deaminase; AltName: Full=Adenosine aminohydrolase [[Haemophilus] ducreyi 35000HP]AAP95347.1 putative adenosine deaminase [[Haemophilus] ducreyi 35000HP]AKO30469.1 adenosine deaminase [[Haemophilus] ducreyi]AKO31904.1 adenosine deaminase [[Haemophilus] ducreyi]AKO33358.1 adenosine deaminase [[Haemophilus] ducreyi]AKO34806.1 adenosine deaminase [[Haemophilus] ducreyi]